MLKSKNARSVLDMNSVLLTREFWCHVVPRFCMKTSGIFSTVNVISLFEDKFDTRQVRGPSSIVAVLRNCRCSAVDNYRVNVATKYYSYNTLVTCLLVQVGAVPDHCLSCWHLLVFNFSSDN